MSKTKKGFTLIELLVVITILGLLAGLLISNVSGVRERARDSQRKSDLREIKTALRMYKNDYGRYPAAAGEGSVAFQGCGGKLETEITDCSWGGAFERADTTYMKLLPLDPISGDGIESYYSYSYIDIDDFSLVALLENMSDPDIADSQEKCGIAIEQALAGGYYVCAD